MTQSRSPSTLVRLDVVAVTVTVSYGWVVEVRQLSRDGWIDGGGTAWLLAMSVIATVGALVGYLGHRSGSRSLVAAGLALVAVSPTGLAYVLNVAVLALAVVELGLAISDRRSRRVADAL